MVVARCTSRNQPTLTKAVVERAGPADDSDVLCANELCANGRLVLTPIRPGGTAAVRSRLAEPGISEVDMDEVVLGTPRLERHPISGPGGSRCSGASLNSGNSCWGTSCPGAKAGTARSPAAPCLCAIPLVLDDPVQTLAILHPVDGQTWFTGQHGWSRSIAACSTWRRWSRPEWPPCQPL